jgi:hypothetical protein
MVHSMKTNKTLLALVGVALVLAGTLYLTPALAHPIWSEPTEDGELGPPYRHRYLNGTWTLDEDGELQPPCWDPETGEYVPRYNGTQQDWCPYEEGQAGGLGGMWRNWSGGAQQGSRGFRGGMMQGYDGDFRRGGGCGRTG